MTTLIYLLCSMNSLTIRHAPAAARLHVRLTTSVGSYGSRVGTPVEAVLIAPVILDDQTALPAGSTLSGRVKAVTRVGLGIRHERAGLELEFSALRLPSGETMIFPARVSQVDNGRERTNRDGRIQGIRATASLSYRVSGYIKTALLLGTHAQLVSWAVKSLIVQLPEPEIYYPAGVELTLALTHPMASNARIQVDRRTAGLLADDELAGLRNLAAAMPFRANVPDSHRPSDVMNVLFIGSRDRIAATFRAAEWTEAQAPSLRCRIGWIRAVAERRGYAAAPMSPLSLNGAGADMSWQKGLNDVSKRHHIRVWRQPGLWQDQEFWIGAATRDIDFAYLRPGRTLTHKIEENVDEERDKVAYDFAFTSCAEILDWTLRPDVPRVTRNGTGDPIFTDTRLAIVRLNDCLAPRRPTSPLDATDIPAHGGKLQRFARREILSMRSDLIRANPYWRTYEAVRWMVEHRRPDSTLPSGAR